MWICSHKITRVFIRNLHQTTKLDTIKEELELRLFEVRRVTNVLHKITKAPLPLFFVDLEPSGKLNKIYQLSSLFHTKLKSPISQKLLINVIIARTTATQNHIIGISHKVSAVVLTIKYSDCPNQHTDLPKRALCVGTHPYNL